MDRLTEQRQDMHGYYIRFTDQTDWTNDSYGKTWLAFRSKPKEEV